MMTETTMLAILQEDAGMLRVWLEDFPEIQPTQAAFELAVQKDPMLLKLVPPENQTEEMCLDAVSHDYRALKFVHDQTYRIVNEAFCEYHRAQYGHDPKRFIHYGGSLNYSPLHLLKDWSKDNLLCAVSYDGRLVKDIHGVYLDDDIRIVAIKQNPDCFITMDRGYPHESEAVAVVAVEAGVELWLIKHPQTPAICQAAVQANPEAIKYVKDVSMLETGPKM